MSKPTDQAPSSRSSLPGPLQLNDDPHLDSVRSILLAQERERIRILEELVAALGEQSQEHNDAFLLRIAALQEEIDGLKEASLYHQQRAATLEAELEVQQQQRAAESASLIPRMVQNISLILSSAAVKSRSALSSALGPVMGDAIQVQIRDSQDEMVEALYPIILATVQRAIAEFGRDLQRNIDARLKATLGPRGALQTFFARLRGVSASELVLRESLPFYIDELFLIQRDTGLLMAHSYDKETEAHDSDLIGGMLTAIRDFTRDSFGDGTLGEELDEIQYGEERIIIESGASAYVAAVVRGVEPQGFRGRLRTFITELHGQYGQQFADYDGDMATLPDLAPALAGFDHEFSSIATVEPQAMPRSQRLMLWGAGLAGLLLLACSCFYLQFTVALLPAAFGNTPTIAATALPTETVVASATPTATATATASASATVPPSPTSTPAPTETAIPSPTASDTATAIAPSITPTVVLPVTNAPVWTRLIAADDAPLETIIAAQTVVTILDRDGDWVEVSWDSDQGPRRGWIVSRFLDLNGEALENLIVPAPGG